MAIEGDFVAKAETSKNDGESPVSRRRLQSIVGYVRKPSTATVVMMSKREAELKDIRSKTTVQLQEEVVDLKGELFMLRLQKSARNEFKSSEFRRMKKQVARMLTVKREREIFEHHGESFFRGKETDALKQLSSMYRVVVSTGGGA